MNQNENEISKVLKTLGTIIMVIGIIGAFIYFVILLVTSVSFIFSFIMALLVAFVSIVYAYMFFGFSEVVFLLKTIQTDLSVMRRLISKDETLTNGAIVAKKSTTIANSESTGLGGDSNKLFTTSLPNIYFDKMLPVRILNTYITEDHEYTRFQIELKNYNGFYKYVRCDIDLRYLFNEKVIVKDCLFEFENTSTGTLKSNILKRIKDKKYTNYKVMEAYVTITGLANGIDDMDVIDTVQVNDLSIEDVIERRRTFGKDVFCEKVDLESSWVCVCGKENSIDDNKCQNCKRANGVDNQNSLIRLIEVCKECNLLIELKKVLEQHIQDNGSGLDNPIEELLKPITTDLEVKRMYGMKPEVEKEKITKYCKLLEAN